MKVVPASGPVIESNTAPSQSQQSARARAVAILQGTTQQLNAAPSQTPPADYPASPRPAQRVAGHPVADPSSIAAEELSAITSEVQGTTEEAVQDTTTEAAVQAAEPAVTPAPTEEAQISSQYAQLARQQKAFRAAQVAAKAQEAQLKQREEAIKAREAEMLSKYIPKDSFAKDPVKVLQEQGFTPEQITNMMLNQPDPAEQKLQSTIEQLNAKIKALEDGQESTKKSFEDNQKAQYTQAVNMIRNETKQLVSADPNFETIKATDSVEDVVELITKTFNDEGRMMSVEEAAQAVEDHLVEEVEKIVKLQKFQKRLKAAPAPAAAVVQTTPKTATKTLTSSMNNTRPLTAKERAILAFKGELKKE